jgi:hypothetical protein
MHDCEPDFRSEWDENGSLLQDPRLGEAATASDAAKAGSRTGC